MFDHCIADWVQPDQGQKDPKLDSLSYRGFHMWDGVGGALLKRTWKMLAILKMQYDSVLCCVVLRQALVQPVNTVILPVLLKKSSEL